MANKNELTFTGKITHIEDVKKGESAKGAWASLKFQVTENKDEYPQVGNFSYFKNGENVKYADDFAKMYPVGTEVVVTFNLATSEWQGKFFADVRAWKVEKVTAEETQSQEIPVEYPEEDINPESIPF